MCARRMGAEKIFLVSDSGIEKAGWVEKLLDILAQEQLNWVYYSDVHANPRDWQIQQGAKLYKDQDCDVVMAIGGGSPMDAAKGIALVAGNGGRVNDYEGANRIRDPLPPMIFIPSTASSGSDISQFTIITDMERKVKMSIISRTLVPNVSIIDPELLTTKSRSLIIAAALDALAHAIEAHVSRIASPMTEVHSLKAIEMIFHHLSAALETRSIDHLEKLSMAGTFAAMAFSNAGLGIDHALAHSLGGSWTRSTASSIPFFCPRSCGSTLSIVPTKSPRSAGLFLANPFRHPGKLLWQVLKIWKHTLKALRSLPNYVISYRTGPNSKGSARWLPWIPAC